MSVQVPAEAVVTVDILYRDDALLVVDKPAGLVVHRGWARDRQTLSRIVSQQLGQQVLACHRLDRGTSGALLFALDADVARMARCLFDAGRVEKTYLAWIRGHCQSRGLIDYALAKSKGSTKRPARSSFTRLASVEFENPEELRYPRRYSLVLAKPYTGRLHQVRRHFRHLRHPLIGDTRYGKKEHNAYCAARFGLQRLALHASHLSFEHPVTGELVACRAPLPSDLSQPLSAAGFLDSALEALNQPIWRPDVGDLPVLN